MVEIKKKITMSMRWLCWMLCGMGTLFMGVGIAVCFLIWRSGRMSPEEMHLFFIVFLGLFGSFGIIMSAIGIIIGCRISYKERQKRRLLRDGECVWADFVEIFRKINVHINGRHPLILRCKYSHSDGKTYLFKSDNLRYDPQAFLPGGRVRVWFDRDNIKKYYVDVENSMIEKDFIEL